MSKRKTFFERITGTVNVNDRDRYNRIDIDVTDEETYYNDDSTDLRDIKTSYGDQYDQPGRIDNSLYNKPQAAPASNYTNNTSTFNNDWLPQSDHGSELSVDVYELDEEIVLQAMISGVRPEDLDINVTREMVTIEGHREGPQGIPNNNYYQQELFWGAFNRTVMLPAEVEVEEAEAHEAHGLLTIRMPKLDKARSTKLKVRSRS
jgi:HSP20 family protein